MVQNVKNPSRKYIDLINSTSSKWANWNPSKSIKVGDYGTLDKETGEFVKDGNIYEGDNHELTDIAKAHPPEGEAVDSPFVVTSLSVKSREFKAEHGVGVVGLDRASAKGRWEFGKRRGALLIMAHPSSSRIPPQVLLKDLVSFPEFKENYLVTQVYHCNAYGLYFSIEDNDVLSAALVDSGLKDGEVAKTTWWNKHSGGLFRGGCDARGQDPYTPLYILKEVRRPGPIRRIPARPPREGDDLWINARQTWEPLDDDGEEQEFEDTIFD